jgi:hypothetical protein
LSLQIPTFYPRRLPYRAQEKVTIASRAVLFVVLLASLTPVDVLTRF